MEKIKKWMTVMALIGTVLVTGLFCYMPIREIIKEYQKDTISLSGEETLGTAEEAQDLLENMTEMSENKAENAGQESGKQDGDSIQKITSLPKVMFQIKGEEQTLETALWQNEEGICYVFLPGFAKEAELQVHEIEEKGSFMLGNQSFGEKDVLTDIAWEEAYAFTLYDKAGTEIMRAPLIFLCSSDLPVLAISTKSESMEEIDASKVNRETGNVVLLGEAGQLIYEGAAKEIAGRGNSTFGLAKKPYQFKLEEKADFFGFGASADWNLLADGYDETKLRNRIVLGLAKELGMEYTPEGRSVDVYCNGVYYGVYFLCENIQVEEGRVEISDMEAYTKAVYSQTELENLKSVTSEDGNRKWTTSEVPAKDITGGYLFERELIDRYQTEDSGFVTKQKDAYVLQSPRHATEEQVNYIADYMQEFQDALWEKDGICQVTGKHYSEYIDMDSFVNKYLLEEVVRNYDGGVTSSYFYKKSDAQGGKLYAGPAWDYDASLGNCNLDKIVSNPVGISKLNDHIYGTEVFAKLYEKEEFYEKVMQAYEGKVVPYLERLLAGEIDRLAKEMEQAVKLDSIRWTELDNRYQYYEKYENNVRYLKYYIEERKNFLDEVWLEGVVYHSVTFMVDGQSWKKMYVKDGEALGAEPIPSRYSSLFMGWLSKEWDVPYDEFKPIYEDMIFYATWQQLPVEEVVITSGTEGP